MRLGYLADCGLRVESIPAAHLAPAQVRNNIESFVGAVEVPVGLVGPLLFVDGERHEHVHAVAGTLEGALVASMNRGAKAVSLAGGFTAHVAHQKMIRTPMFIFATLADSVRFAAWIETHSDAIRTIAERHSNHARLVDLRAHVVGRSVHVRFVFTTGDATGQNMTTACTWHATLWIERTFEAETGIAIATRVVEGNGASDKKISGFAISHGRGVHVVAECHMPEHVIASVLRTSSAEIAACFNQSVAMSRLDGMVGYNINVANAIAAIFVATGQDLGSLHESCTGVLNVERTDDGLYLSLNLPTLVAGTVGGGTHLPSQREALELMGCFGSGRLVRFASLIAGFALALEISTYAAIVSGQFAKAHEKLGRNKPVRWLLKSEIDRTLVASSLNGSFAGRRIDSVGLPERDLLDNGILMSLTSRVSRKLCGFVPIEVVHRPESDPRSEPASALLLMKIKPLDREVIEGLHHMAAAVDAGLADLLYECRDALEYRDCHTKEIALYELLHRHAVPFIPDFHGRLVEESREIYLFIQELLDDAALTHFNDENAPERWDAATTRAVIAAITQIHRLLAPVSASGADPTLAPFEPWRSERLYARMIALAADYHRELVAPEQAGVLLAFVSSMESERARLDVVATVVHNDFNPRNVAIRVGGVPCIYDWELSVVDVPHRDVVEFLSFSLEEDFDRGRLVDALEAHYAMYADDPARPGRGAWWGAYRYAIRAYLATRVAFYLVGDIVTRYEFAPRIWRNAWRMLAIVEQERPVDVGREA